MNNFSSVLRTEQALSAELSDLDIIILSFCGMDVDFCRLEDEFEFVGGLVSQIDRLVSLGYIKYGSVGLKISKEILSLISQKYRESFLLWEFDYDECVDISYDVQAIISFIDAHLSEMNSWELLGVDEGSGGEDVRRSYFRISRYFHPDRYFRKNTGKYGDKISSIYQAMNVAYHSLSS